MVKKLTSALILLGLIEELCITLKTPSWHLSVNEIILKEGFYGLFDIDS